MDVESKRLKDEMIRLSENLRNLIKFAVDSGEEVDYNLRSLSELMDLSVKCNQTEVPFEDDYQDVTRVVRLRVRLSLSEIQSMFGVTPVSIYGEGLYFPIEGILLPPSFSKESGYDRILEGKQKVTYCYEPLLPKEVVDTHEFRLTVPAIRRHIFIPKKCSLINWVNSTRAIQFFDPRVK